MDIVSTSKHELIDSIASMLITANTKTSEEPSEYDSYYDKFISDVRKGKDASVELPLEYVTRHDLFELIKSGTVFVNCSVRFKMSITTKRPVVDETVFESKYIGNEFSYSFLDNHPGILNIDHLKDVPIDYEGLMAVPPTVLEYKTITRFNIHRVIYDPVFIGRHIYTRVVVSNKAVLL